MRDESHVMLTTMFTFTKGLLSNVNSANYNDSDNDNDSNSDFASQSSKRFF